MAEPNYREERLKKIQEEAAAATEERLKFIEDNPTFITNPPEEIVSEEQQQEKSKLDSYEVAEKPRGIVSQAGEIVEGIISGDYVNDALVQPLKAILPEGSPFTLTSDEQEEVANKAFEGLNEKENGLSKFLMNTNRNVEAVGEGAKAGALLPFTVVADLTNQEASWSAPPARMEDSFWAPTLFEIAEIAVPTMLTSGLLGMPLASTAIGARGLRAGIESAAAQDVDQLMFGRTLASKVGDLGEQLGFGDADEITKSMIAGTSLESKAFLKTAAFIQSYIFDLGADKLLGMVTKNVKPGPVAERIAKLNNTTPQNVQDVMADTYEAAYSKVLEPEDVVTGNTVAPTQRAKDGKLIAKESLQAEIMRTTGIAEDGLTNAQRKYFTNIDAITSETSLQNVIEETLKDVPRLVDNNTDKKRAMFRALSFWKRNSDLLDENFPKFLNTFASELTTQITDREVKSISKYLSADASLDLMKPESFLVATMVAEEMSVKVAKMATVVNNLTEIGANTTFAEKELMQLMKKSQMILRPLRRAKRIWSLDGRFQQRLTREEFNNLLDEVTPEVIKDVDAPAVDVAFEGNEYTLEALYSLAKGGDKDAKKALKTLYAQLSAGDARQALQTVEVGGEIIKKKLAGGRGDAATSLFYNVGLLSRIATMTTAVSGTILRQVLEPTAGIVGGLAGSATLEGRKQLAYSAGQLVGGFVHMGEAWQMMSKSFITNKPLSGTTRFSKKVTTHLEKQVQLDANWRATRKIMQDEGAGSAEMFYAWADYTMQSLANNPVVNAPTRFLMSFDTAGQTTAFNGNIMGKAAMYSAVDLDFSKVGEIYKSIRKDAIGKTGELFNGIRDPQLLEVSKFQTFQRPITTGPDATQFDKFFSGLESATQESGFWKFISPFARISWDFLDQAQLAAAGSLPVVGNAILSKTNPKYIKMLKGEMGLPAKMQAKQVQALSFLTAAFMVNHAMNGNATGKNSGMMPKDSFIVPAPTKAGYMAVPFDKIQPYGALMSITADLVNNYRIGGISRGEYQQGLSEIIASIIDNTFDATTLTGIVNFTDFVSRGAAQKGWLNDVVDLFSVPLAPSFTRMIGQISEPFRKAVVDRGNPIDTAAASYVQRAGGGAGLPIMTDIYSNTPDATVATASSGQDWWEAIRGSFVNEFAYPGKIKDAYKDAGWAKLIQETGYKVSKRYLQDVEGIPLDLNSQAMLSKEIGELGLGKSLTEYYNSGVYKRKWEKFNKARKRGGALGILDNEAKIILDTIRSDIRDIHETIKERAIQNGHLFENPEFKKRYLEKKMRASAGTPQTNAQGMYATAANQSTELASQVREILDIPV